MSVASNLARATSSAEEVRLADGSSVRVKALRTAAMGQLQAIVNRMPGPRELERVRPFLDGLPSDAVAPIVAAARDRDASWPPNILLDTWEAIKVFTSDPSTFETLARLAVPDRPDILDACTPDQYQRIVFAAFNLPTESGVREQAAQLVATAVAAGKTDFAADLEALARKHWPDPEEPDGPKGVAPPPDPSTG